MRSCEAEHFGNPGSPHREGVVAKEALKNARESVARALSVKPEEVTFTSGGTEANNLGLLGVIDALRVPEHTGELHVLTTPLEHSSVLAPFRALAEAGVRVEHLAVTSEGHVDIADLKRKLKRETVLVSVNYVNGEVGTVERLRDISRVLAVHRTSLHLKTPYFHTDASQAPLYLNCVLEHLGVDLMTLDGQKIYGPKGVGALIHRHHVSLRARMLGGGQEAGLRSGTEPVALIVGFSAALTQAQGQWKEESVRVGKLRDLLLAELSAEIPHLVLNGSFEERVANNLNISLPGVDTEFLVLRLDVRGIAAATRSACEAGEGQSHVVFALSRDEVRARSALRLTLPRDIRKKEVLRAAKVIAEEVKKLTERK
jgi:cysteine desulfurase